MTEPATETFGMTLLLRDDPALIEAYRAHHRTVWPVVKDRILEVGIHRMEIFLIGRRLFMWFEAPAGFDPSRDFARLMADPRYVEWDTLMRTMQERAPEASPADWWAPMEKVFDLGWRLE
jgi:L-rhamnose mutarotase